MEEVHVYEGGGGIASVGGVVLMCDWLLLRSKISIGEFPNIYKSFSDPSLLNADKMSWGWSKEKIKKLRFSTLPILNFFFHEDFRESSFG